VSFSYYHGGTAVDGQYISHYVINAASTDGSVVSNSGLLAVSYGWRQHFGFETAGHRQRFREPGCDFEKCQQPTYASGSLSSKQTTLRMCASAFIAVDRQLVP
jgi:hypothetical protein